MNTYSISNDLYEVREEMHQGKKHLVVPVVMMVEGVHSGSQGPVFHSIDQLGRFPESWNGIPVSIKHPVIDGKNVSANSPNIIDSVVVGRVYNTFVDGNKLKGEAWLDAVRLKQVSPATAAYLDKKQPIEVSLGMFSDNINEGGEWNGETYVAEANNHRPDHLALLPGGRGACSWEDGCGIRTNEEYKEENIMPEENKPCCPEKVEMLIQDENSKFTEADRDWLLTQSAETLEKLQPVIIEKEVEKIVNNQETPTKEMAIQVLQETFSDPNKFLSLLPTDIREQMESGLQLHKEKRENTIAQIIANQAGNVWTKEELAEMNTALLNKLANSMPIRHDFSGQSMGSPIQSNAATEDKLLPPGITIQ